MENDVIQLNRLSVLEEYRDLPLMDIEREHLRIPVSDDEDYLLVDGEEEWETKFLPAPDVTVDEFQFIQISVVSEGGEPFR